MTVAEFDVVVVAGGPGSRIGGDKAMLDVGGRSLLERVLEAAAGAARTIIVGPRREVSRPVVWCREQPAGGGPVAALAEGLRHVSSEVCVVLAVDLPLVTAASLDELVDGLRGVDAALATDERGRDQYLLGAYRTSALRAALDAIGDPGGASMRRLVEHMALERIPLGEEAEDIDTAADLEAARRGRHSEVSERPGPEGPAEA